MGDLAYISWFERSSAASFLSSLMGLRSKSSNALVCDDNYHGGEPLCSNTCYGLIQVGGRFCRLSNWWCCRTNQRPNDRYQCVAGQSLSDSTSENAWFGLADCSEGQIGDCLSANCCNNSAFVYTGGAVTVGEGCSNIDNLIDNISECNHTANYSACHRLSHFALQWNNLSAIWYSMSRQFSNRP